jgi:hypothetical protein
VNEQERERLDRVIKDCQAELARMPDLLEQRDRALAALYFGGQGSHRQIGDLYDLGETTVRNAARRHRPPPYPSVVGM